MSGSNDIMTKDDMVFQNINGTRYTGGYKINNMFKDTDVGPYSYIQHGGSAEILMDSVFKNLAVPTGLLFLQQTYNTKTNKSYNKIMSDDVSVVKDDLYTSLLDMVSVTKKTKKSKRNTRKNRKRSNKKSRKQR